MCSNKHFPFHIAHHLDRNLPSMKLQQVGSLTSNLSENMLKLNFQCFSVSLASVTSGLLLPGSLYLSQN